MSWYSEGYDKGYADAIEDDDQMYGFLTGHGSAIMDFLIPTDAIEEEWSEGSGAMTGRRFLRDS